MHELSLYSQVPASRHTQVLQILTGIAAMQPQNVVERHFVFKPARVSAQRSQVGGSQAIQSQKSNTQAQAPKELFYMQLVCDVPQGDMNDSSHAAGFNGLDSAGDIDVERKEPSAPDNQHWSMQFHDIPEPGKRPVVARMLNKTDIREGDAHQFMKGLGYDYVTEYVLQGHRLIYGNIILLLHQILRYHDDTEPRNEPRSTMPGIDALHPLDGSSSYLLQAAVRVQDGSKPNVVTQGQNELLRLKEMMKGSIDLRVVDRLSLDTRFR